MKVLRAIAFGLVLSMVPTFAYADQNKDLINAASEGDIEKVKALLEGGADVNIKSDSGTTPLISASFGGYTDIMQLLIENGADVNAKLNIGTTALNHAAFYGHTSAVKLLLDNGADINATWKDGTTALDVARKAGHNKIVQLLRGAQSGGASGEENSSSPSQNIRGDVRVKGEMNPCAESVLKELQANPATRNTPINGQVFVSCENGYVTLEIDCNSWANIEARAKLRKNSKANKNNQGEKFSWGGFLEQSRPENNIYGQVMIQMRECEKHITAIAKTAKHAGGIKDVNIVDK